MAALASCTPPLTIVPASTRVQRSYEIGELESAIVGEPIFRVSRVIQRPAFTATRTYVEPSGRQIIKGGATYVAEKRDPDGNLLMIPLDTTGWTRTWHGVVMDTAGRVGVLPAGGRSVRWETTRTRYFAPADEAALAAHAMFTAELIYSGLAGTVIRAVYREYANDIARPAFSQEIQYDIATDRVIAYRTVRIRIEEATPSSLRFRIEDDGGLPWVR